MWPNPQETADLVTFTEEILSGKLHVLCSDGPIIWSLVPEEVRYTDSLEKLKIKSEVGNRIIVHVAFVKFTSPMLDF